MKIRFLLLLGIVSFLSAEDTDFQTLERRFQQRLLQIHRQNASSTEVLARIQAVHAEEFGPHPELLRGEWDRRYQALEPFDLQRLEHHETRAEMDLTVSGEHSYAMVLPMWRPEMMGAWMRSVCLSRNLEVEVFAGRSMLSSWIPDKTFRGEEGGRILLIVESLGEFFVITLEQSGAGNQVPIPKHVQWRVPPATSPGP